MGNKTPCGDLLVKVRPSALIETTQLVRSSRTAIKCINGLLADAEEGSTVVSNDLASVLMLVRERMDSALDELEAMCNAAMAQGVDHGNA